MKARVLPGNSYGGDAPGTIVDVDEDEIKKVPWCLEAVDAEAEAKAAAEAESVGHPRMLTDEDIAHITKMIDDARSDAAAARDQLTKVCEENDQLRAENAALKAAAPPAPPAPQASPDLQKPAPAIDLEQASSPTKPVDDQAPAADASAPADPQASSKKGKGKS